MLQVKVFPTLAKRSVSGQTSLEIPWEPGMRVVDIINREGFFGEEADVIAAVINGEMADSNQSPISDGDHVELIVALAGG